MSDTSIPPINVLLVDDDPDQLALMGLVLKKNGLSVTPASSIDSAYAALNANVVDVIVCDGNMPGGGARGLLKLMKENPQSYPPLIAVTAGKTDREVIELGASRLFVKQGSMNDIVAACRELARTI